FGALDRPGSCPSGRSTALVDPSRLLDEVGRGRRLGNEAERAILENRDQCRDDRPRLRRGALVVLLQERHHVDAMLTQRGTHGRSGRRLSRGQLQRNYGLDLLCHYISSVERVVDQTIRCTCRKSSSTGVSRPKKDTSTRTLPFSGLMSSTTPMKSVKGPSTTFTRSPR